MASPSFGMMRKPRLTLSTMMGSRFSKLQAFFDPLLVVVDASRNDEARDAVIGLDKRWNLLYVVYIERENDILRIISARKATRKKREYYES
jgi:uncharacterized protein